MSRKVTQPVTAPATVIASTDDSGMTDTSCKVRQPVLRAGCGSAKTGHGKPITTGLPGHGHRSWRRAMAAIAVAGIAATAAACGSNSNAATPAASGGGTGLEKPNIVVATVPA